MASIEYFSTFSIGTGSAGKALVPLKEIYRDFLELHQLADLVGTLSGSRSWSSTGWTEDRKVPTKGFVTSFRVPAPSRSNTTRSHDRR